MRVFACLFPWRWENYVKTLLRVFYQSGNPLKVIGGAFSADAGTFSRTLFLIHLKYLCAGIFRQRLLSEFQGAEVVLLKGERTASVVSYSLKQAIET